MLDLLLVLFVLWLVGMVLGGLGLGALHLFVWIERIVRAINRQMKIQYPRP